MISWVCQEFPEIAMEIKHPQQLCYETNINRCCVSMSHSWSQESELAYQSMETAFGSQNHRFMKMLFLLLMTSYFALGPSTGLHKPLVIKFWNISFYSKFLMTCTFEFIHLHCTRNFVIS